MLRADKICKSFGGRTILSDVSFTIGPHQKIALIGFNGSGKSTVLKLLAGLDEPDSGSVDRTGQPRIGYLPQEISLSTNDSIETYLKKSSGLGPLEDRLRALEKNLSAVGASEEYGDLQKQFTVLDGFTFDHRAKLILDGFGLQLGLDRSVHSLSGGQKAKVMIAGLLLSKPDILLMDEPTNNLDLPAVIWLEQFLAHSDTAMLIVSHDRKFLDRIVAKTIEIDWFTRRVREYPGSFSEYLAYRQAKIDKERETALLQRREKKEMVESIREKKQWAAQGKRQITTDNDKYIRGRRRDRSAKSAKTAKAMEKQLDRMDQIEVSAERPRLTIPLVARHSDAKHSIRLENVAFAYSHGFSLGPVNVHICYGSRVGIIGLNGTGKTTLLKLITGEIRPQTGRVVIGKSLIIGDLTQTHENLPPDKTIAEYLAHDQQIDPDRMALLLVKFNFTHLDARKTISVLSPGERARLLLLVFSEKHINTLVLDEPTNHLDLEALEALEYALKGYTGIVIFVSHDRDFIEKLRPDSLYVIDRGRTEMVSDYQQYLQSAQAGAERLLRLYRF